MKKKGFTLIELLVVIAIIAMLMAILMPALGKVKRMAERIVCGSNLRGLGNSIAVYASDYDDEYPVHDFGSDGNWGELRSGWNEPPRTPKILAEENRQITVSSSLYLLVREADVDPKVFVCKSSDEKAFEGVPDIDLVELWDFGGEPKNAVSYSYQLPMAPSGYTARPVSGSSDPSMAVLADKSPWCDETLAVDGQVNAEDFMSKTFSYEVKNGEGAQAGNLDSLENLPKWVIQVNNSGNHQREGQNVLYNDMHVTFEKRADVGVNQDNIWTQYRGGIGGTNGEYEKRVGQQAFDFVNIWEQAVPVDRTDNALLGDERPSNTK